MFICFDDSLVKETRLNPCVLSWIVIDFRFLGENTRTHRLIYRRMFYMELKVGMKLYGMFASKIYVQYSEGQNSAGLDPELVI